MLHEEGGGAVCVSTLGVSAGAKGVNVCMLSCISAHVNIFVRVGRGYLCCVLSADVGWNRKDSLGKALKA